jgi:hypothetical protein
MSFEDFQHLARLYVVGALDEDEMLAFENSRRDFGESAEEFIKECRQLSAAFALSLRPQPTREDAKQKLMNMIRRNGQGEERIKATGDWNT